MDQGILNVHVPELRYPRSTTSSPVLRWPGSLRVRVSDVSGCALAFSGQCLQVESVHDIAVFVAAVLGRNPGHLRFLLHGQELDPNSPILSTDDIAVFVAAVLGRTPGGQELDPNSLILSTGPSAPSTSDHGLELMCIVLAARTSVRVVDGVGRQLVQIEARFRQRRNIDTAAALLNYLREEEDCTGELRHEGALLSSDTILDTLWTEGPRIITLELLPST